MKSNNAIEVTLNTPEQDRLFKQLVSAVESLGNKVDRLTLTLSDPEVRQHLPKVLRNKQLRPIQYPAEWLLDAFNGKATCCQEEQ